MLMLEELTNILNPEQKRAVETTDGPLLIQAGAGSGKTKTLTHRIAYILASRKANPYQILAVTFTNKAAKEMRARVADLLGENPENRSFMPYMGTFHSICVRLLRQDGEHIGIPRNFVIWDEDDRTTAVKQIAKSLMLDEKQSPARTIASYISSAKNELITPDEYAASASMPLQKATAQVFPLYEKALREANALDFDDLIGRTVSMLKHQPELRDKWQSQFRYIMIDEYQDTNTAQYNLVKLLTNEHNNIAVVGDDWQSIYSWRGADFRNILKFEKDYKGCTVIRLEQNYRSTKHILDAAHAIITKNTHRSDKKLWTAAGNGSPVQMVQVISERAEAESIVRRVQNSVDIGARQYKDFAVLYRTNAQSRSVEEAFVRYGIPYRIVGGQRFYDRKEIRDILAYVKLVYQPEDRASFARIVNVPTRGLGTTSIQRFINWVDVSGFSLSQGLQNIELCVDLTPKARAAFREFYGVITDFREHMDDMDAAHIIDSLIRRIDYMDYLNDKTVQGEVRQENVRELLSVARGYESQGLDVFLEEVALVSDLDNADFSNNSVTLMTLHAAKGLEFPVVFMTGLEETVFPHSRALYDQSEMEEERRLCYVGMTRAREELVMIYATGRMLYGGSQHNPPSRFLSEIDAEFVQDTPSFMSGSSNFGGMQKAEIPSDSNYDPWAQNDFNQVTNHEESIELLEGDSVRHEVFGAGTVLAVEGENVEIYFKNKGTKRLNTSFAPLQKL